MGWLVSQMHLLYTAKQNTAAHVLYSTQYPPRTLYFSHQYGSWLIASYIHLCSEDTVSLRQQWWGCLQIQPASPQWFLDVRKQKEIVRSKVWTVCRMCRDFPVPVLLQSLDVTTVMWCHYLKEDDDTILQQVWSFEWRTGHTLSCNTTAQYVSLTEVWGGTAWCNTSSAGEKNTTHITFRAPQLFLCNFLHADTAEYHSAIWHFSSGSH